MSRQPSSSFARNDDGNENDPTVLNNCILQLCEMAKIEIQEGDDVTSQTFVESVIEHVREFFGRYYRLIDDHAQQQPFQRRAHVAQLEPGTDSNRRNSTNSESGSSVVSTPVRPPLSPEVISLPSTPQYRESPYFTASPFNAFSATCHVQPSEAAETNIPQNNHHGYHDNMRTAQILSPPQLPMDGPPSRLVSLEEIGQPQRTNETEVGPSGVGMEDNLGNKLLEPVHPSSSHQSGPRVAKERSSTKKKVPIQQDRKKTRKKAKQRKSKSEIHASKDLKNQKTKHKRRKRQSIRKKGQPESTSRQRESDSSPQNPMLMTLQDEQIDFVGQEIPDYGDKHGLASDDEERQVEDSQSSGEDLSRQNGRRCDYGESYGCEICLEAFSHLHDLRSHQLRRHQHEEPQSNGQCVVCILCHDEGKKRIFESSKSFHSHRIECHLVLDPNV